MLCFLCNNIKYIKYSTTLHHKVEMTATLTTLIFAFSIHSNKFGCLHLMDIND